VVNLICFAAIVTLLFDLMRRWSGRRAAILAAVVFVLYPPTGALLSWVSCAQDLVALLCTLGALSLAARGRHLWTAPVVFLAALSKETAVVAPLLLAVVDVATCPGEPFTPRARRLWPGLAGLAAAFAVTLAARSTWPAGSHTGAWSTSQLGAAWRLPIDLIRTWTPPGIGAGLAVVREAGLWRLPAVLVLGALAVPGGSPEAGEAGGVAPARLRWMALAMILVALLPVGMIAERWRGYYLVFAAAGCSVLLGAWLARGPAWAARVVVAALAVVHLGANAYYRPVEAERGAARHPFVNIEFFRATAAVTDQLLAPLEPSCDALRTASRLFAIGVPSDLAFRTTLGPGLRVACRDTALSVRYLAEFEPADATRRFGVIRWLDRDQRLIFEPSNALTLARIGEGFLLHARYDEATACFDAAAAALPGEHELIYPRVLALAAAGHADSARAVWRAATAAGFAPPADTLVSRFAYGVSPARRDSARIALRPLVLAATRDPADADAASRLGRGLLVLGLTRQATLALSVAHGIAHRPTDLVWMAQALEAGGEPDLARDAYIRALQVGLPDPVYEIAKTRLIALGPMAPGVSGLGGTRPGTGRFPGDEK